MVFALNVGTLSCDNLDGNEEKLASTFRGNELDFIILTNTRKDLLNGKSLSDGSRIFLKRNGTGFFINKKWANSARARNVHFKADRLSYLDIPLNQKHMLRLVASYAYGTLERKTKVYDSNTNSKDQTPTFEQHLRTLAAILDGAKTKWNEKGENLTTTFIIAGDFDAVVGDRDTGQQIRDSDANVIAGPYGFGKCDDRGRMLLEFCEKNSLRLQNTMFETHPLNRWTGIFNKYGAGELRPQTSFILSSFDERVLLCANACAATMFNFYTTHRLVVANFGIVVEPSNILPCIDHNNQDSAVPFSSANKNRENVTYPSAKVKTTFAELFAFLDGMKDDTLVVSTLEVREATNNNSKNWNDLPMSKSQFSSGTKDAFNRIKNNVEMRTRLSDLFGRTINQSCIPDDLVIFTEQLLQESDRSTTFARGLCKLIFELFVQVVQSIMVQRTKTYLQSCQQKSLGLHLLVVTELLRLYENTNGKYLAMINFNKYTSVDSYGKVFAHLEFAVPKKLCKLACTTYLQTSTVEFSPLDGSIFAMLCTHHPEYLHVEKSTTTRCDWFQNRLIVVGDDADFKTDMKGLNAVFSQELGFHFTAEMIPVVSQNRTLKFLEKKVWTRSDAMYFNLQLMFNSAQSVSQSLEMNKKAISPPPPNAENTDSMQISKEKRIKVYNRHIDSLLYMTELWTRTDAKQHYTDLVKRQKRLFLQTFDTDEKDFATSLNQAGVEDVHALRLKKKCALARQLLELPKEHPTRYTLLKWIPKQKRKQNREMEIWIDEFESLPKWKKAIFYEAKEADFVEQMSKIFGHVCTENSAIVEPFRNGSRDIKFGFIHTS